MNYKQHSVLVIYLFALLINNANLAKDWQKTALIDLEYVNKSLRENHPGIVQTDTQSYEFITWLEKGFCNACQKLQTIRNYQGYLFTLYYYLNGFHDSHLRIIPKDQTKTVMWPGITVRYCNKQIVVEYADHNVYQEKTPAKGSVLTRCNRTCPETFLEYLALYHANPELASHRYTITPYLLFDLGNPFIKKIEHCTFTEPNGHEVTIELIWQKIDVNQYEQLRAKAQGRKTDTPITIEPFSSNGAWVSLPSFFPQTKQDYEALKKVIRTLKNNTHNLVVFDLRGNGGGSSFWGEKLYEAVFGTNNLDKAKEKIEKNIVTQYRASVENLKHIQALPKIVTGLPKKIVSYLDTVAKGIQQSIKNNLPFYTEHNQNVTSKEKVTIQTNKKVIAIIDQTNASATLNFLDLLKTVPNITLVGIPTGADTCFNEVRMIPLPSGLSALQIPIKKITGTVREHNESYTPDIEYTKNLSGTEELKKCVQDLIENGHF